MNVQLSETVLAAVPGDGRSVAALVTQFSRLPGGRVTPAELEAYRRAVYEITGQYGGVTHELGEGRLLSLFVSKHVSQALRAALALRSRLDSLSSADEADSQRPPAYRIGIGLHKSITHHAASLAAAVSEAASLSALNQQAPFPALFVSEETVRALPDTHGCYVHDLGEVLLPEQPRPLSVYALMRP
jgi:class 3 adenylate cyclase